jgi:hypothetical protein
MWVVTLSFPFSIYSIFFLYPDAPGMVAGLIGLMSLVSQTISKHPGILWLSIAFLAIFAAAPFVSAITMMKFYWKDGGISLAEFLWTVFVVTSSIFIALSAFYSDWCLGLILGHLKGVPSSDNAPLFWTYFVAKRLTLLSR